MNKKRTPAHTRKADVPYNPKSKAATLKYWEGATAHQGAAELHAQHERAAKPVEVGKEQIALRVDKEVLCVVPKESERLDGLQYSIF